MSDGINYIVDQLEQKMQCNCDLDNWVPTGTTGHTSVCRIHKGIFDFMAKARGEIIDE